VPDAQVFDDLNWAKMQKTILEEFDKDLCLIGDCGSATMSFYVAFRGINNAMMDLIEEPELVHVMMQKGTEIAIARGKYWLDNGLRVLRLNDSTGNMSLMSPDHWKEFVFRISKPFVTSCTVTIRKLLYTAISTAPFCRFFNPLR
jgi:uroporphyrinogen-III decarboxylase